ncbi:MAG: rod shape-determining protein MreC [Bacteroidetes bacterium]|nr:rod shape-determining protein MreC [Bacteroidota bacterium]
MRNLIFLIKQFHNFFIFLLLELVCLIIVFRNNSYQQSSYINSSRNIAGKFYSRKEKLVGFMHLSEVNDSLLRENARLRKELGIPIEINPLKDTNYTKTLQSDTVTQTIHYTYIPAKVLNNTIDQKVNYITLDAGSKKGIKKNMAVITPNGIVGRVSHVSENYSVVLSFLSDRFNVSSMVGDGTIGKLSWDGLDPEYAILSGIPQSVKLKRKDTVLTSGFGNFPEKIMVGRIAAVLSGTSYKVFLNTNFRKLHFVYVIADDVNFERKKLEDSLQVNKE